MDLGKEKKRKRVIRVPKRIPFQVPEEKPQEVAIPAPDIFAPRPLVPVKRPDEQG